MSVLGLQMLAWGDMKTELDLYGGFGGAINEDVSYDVGFIYYAYPDEFW